MILHREPPVWWNGGEDVFGEYPLEQPPEPSYGAVGDRPGTPVTADGVTHSLRLTSVREQANQRWYRITDYALCPN